MVKIYNTLSRQKEEFVPQNPPDVKMYVCGITPYDECHIGHARCYVVFDVIRRYLEYKGYKVHYVQNFTDIDDKIINRAKESTQADAPSLRDVKEKTKEIAKKYIVDYFAQMDALNVKKTDEYPRATEHIDEIIKVVKELVDREYAYLLDGDVYFEVEKFKEYGKLSHRNCEEMMPGARVEVDQRKKSPLDFALWKSAKEDEPSWDSPWGKGRPGWHIECSVMSMDHLGSPTLDIHGGGQDLIFPHHENEIAQSESCTGKPFAKYWLHNAFVTVNKEKMSKSLGNFFTIREVLEKYDPMVVRLFLLSAHYRQPMDFSDKELDAAKEELERLNRFQNNILFLLQSFNVDKRDFFREELEGKKRQEMDKNIMNKFSNDIDNFKNKFLETMDDDFNTPKALGYLHEIVGVTNIFMNKIPVGALNIDKVSEVLVSTQKIFNRLSKEILGLNIKPGLSAADMGGLIELREKARKNKDWAAADKIRKELQDKGITIEDTPFGPRLIIKNKII